jgi:fermentation-respiration switch protein FrsA (DUF1100 family)
MDALEAHFRRSGLPHLVADARARDGSLRRRLTAGLLVVVDVLGRVMAAWSYYRGALATSPWDTYQSTVRRSDSSMGV